MILGCLGLAAGWGRTEVDELDLNLAWALTQAAVDTHPGAAAFLARARPQAVREQSDEELLANAERMVRGF